AAAACGLSACQRSAVVDLGPETTDTAARLTTAPPSACAGYRLSFCCAPHSVSLTRDERRAAGLQCAACNAEVPTGSKFCSQCGTALAVACSACSHPNPVTAKFCSKCGKRLTPGSLQSATPSVVAKASASSSAERRQLTIMFCDMVGSSALATQLDP